MRFRKCACGCGKWIDVTSRGGKKFYNRYHKYNYHYAVTHGLRSEMKSIAPSKPIEELTPEERWEAMSLAQVEAESLRLHMSYGKLQGAYYNNCLPDDFGLTNTKKGWQK